MNNHEFLNENIVVSGMRPTGLLHLGHYHGALKNWINLQAVQPCYFFVADCFFLFAENFWKN